MGSTLEHGIYLPSEGEKNCYSGLANNWQTVDTNIGYVTALRQAIAGALTRQIVTQLPTEDIDTNCIYMILKATAQTSNIYDEYMYINSNWELIGDSQLDLSNYYTKQEVNQLPAVASGVTATKVGNYDAHIANGDIHVTASDKAKWDTLALIKHLRLVNAQVGSATTIPFSDFDDTNGIKVGDKCMDLDAKLFEITAVDTTNQTVTVGTALIDIALDPNVVHNSGDETVSGAKSFTDATTVSLIKSVTNLATGSTTGSSILPLSATITYTDGTATKTAKLNFRIQSDGSVALYPHENGICSLGLVSRNWDNVFSYMFECFGKNLGNEFSNNARTDLYLKANRDTSGQSGVYISKFRQNRAQGEMGNLDVVQVTFDVLENSVRTNRTWYLNYLNWENDVPKTVEIRSLCEKVDYKLTHINDMTPSSLGMPDLDSGVDISGYVTVPNASSTYTPSVNGWISIVLKSTSGALGCFINQGDFALAQYGATALPNETEPCAMLSMPVTKGITVNINTKGQNAYIYSAKFFPCLGNV